MRAAVVRMVERRAAVRRASIAAALTAAGVEAVVVGEDVRASGRGIVARWWRDMTLRDAGRGRL
ncbi:hypothetical protein [Sphingobium sp.]|uniref:hypothetical protein n=1 Tax=Sphingobium sp. TaxID=1912891 RepID=UPI003BB68A42